MAVHKPCTKNDNIHKDILAKILRKTDELQPIFKFMRQLKLSHFALLCPRYVIFYFHHGLL